MATAPKIGGTDPNKNPNKKDSCLSIFIPPSVLKPSSARRNSLNVCWIDSLNKTDSQIAEFIPDPFGFLE